MRVVSGDATGAIRGTNERRRRKLRAFLRPRARLRPRAQDDLRLRNLGPTDVKTAGTMRRVHGGIRTLMRSLVAVAVAALALSAGTTASAATAPWVTLHPPRVSGASLQLPTDWQPVAPDPPVKFMAQTDDGFTYMMIGSNAYPRQSFDEFAAWIGASGRQFYLSRYPKASFRWRKVTLPVGRAVELIVRIPAEGPSQPALAVHAFDFMSGNKAYSFTFSTHSAKLGTYLPIFRRSAQSIRFRS